MSLLIVFLAVAGVFCDEMLVTKEYTEYLKTQVDWEVVDYEENIFRGWTVEEAKSLLIQEIPEYDEPLPMVEADNALPAELDWGKNCIHPPGDQGRCGSCWAFSAAGMLSDRCCLHSKKDHGWLSPQELVSCEHRSRGCRGGWPSWALTYVIKNDGLVPEACYPYKAVDERCPHKCVNGMNWKGSHVCKCMGLKQCIGVDSMKTCLKNGPISVAFYVSRSFFKYKGGIYKCDASFMGLHAVVATGYSDKGECYWIVKNSWGIKWGMNGYFHIACKTCGIHGNYANGNVMCDKVK